MGQATALSMEASNAFVGPTFLRFEAGRRDAVRIPKPQHAAIDPHAQDRPLTTLVWMKRIGNLERESATRLNGQGSPGLTFSFLWMLADYVAFLIRSRLAPILFDDHDARPRGGGAERKSIRRALSNCSASGLQ